MTLGTDRLTGEVSSVLDLRQQQQHSLEIADNSADITDNRCDDEPRHQWTGDDARCRQVSATSDAPTNITAMSSSLHVRYCDNIITALIIHQSWSSLVSPGHHWPVLIIAGQTWSSLARPGHRWPVLVITGQSWSSLASLGHYWSVLVIAGQSWSSLTSPGHR